MIFLIRFPLEERFNVYDEMSKCECGDDLVERKKESEVFDANTSINCFTYLIPTFERIFSLDFVNASIKGKNISFYFFNNNFEQKKKLT